MNECYDDDVELLAFEKKIVALVGIERVAVGAVKTGYGLLHARFWQRGGPFPAASFGPFFFAVSFVSMMVVIDRPAGSASACTSTRRKG